MKLCCLTILLTGLYDVHLVCDNMHVTVKRIINELYKTRFDLNTPEAIHNKAKRCAFFKKTEALPLSAEKMDVANRFGIEISKSCSVKSSDV